MYAIVCNPHLGGDAKINEMNFHAVLINLQNKIWNLYSNRIFRRRLIKTNWKYNLLCYIPN